MFEDRRHGRKSHLHLPGDEIRDRGARAAIRHRHQVDAGCLTQLLARKMHRRAEPRQCIGHAGFLLRQRDKLLRARRRHRRMHDEHQRRGGDQRDRREILARVVGQLRPEQAGIDREGAVDQPDGVAVGRRGRDRLRADLARPAAAIVDHEALLELLLESGRKQARQDVGRTARRIGHDDTHRL